VRDRSIGQESTDALDPSARLAQASGRGVASIRSNAAGTTGQGVAGQAWVSVYEGTTLLWRFLVVRPSVSSGASGSGVELRYIDYRGKRVLHQAHVPILNVLVSLRQRTAAACERDDSPALRLRRHLELLRLQQAPPPRLLAARLRHPHCGEQSCARVKRSADRRHVVGPELVPHNW